jgi:site-specific recombinase XerD
MISRSKATVKIVLAHRSKKSKIDGKQSIQLRIIYNRKPKYYALGYSVTEEDFIKMFSGQVRGELRELKIRLQDIEAKANNIIQNIDPFSISKFESGFFRPRNTHNNVIRYLEKEIEKAQEEGRISSRIMVECSLNSFLSFTSKCNLSFNDVTIEWLKAYERHMIKNGNSPSTVGMYLRGMRKIFNKAINDGIVTRDQYPFGKSKYEIPTSRNIKKALNNTDIKKILEFNPKPGSKEAWAKDMWTFIYLCNGINPKDTANLKYKDIDNDYITFVRTKTKTSRKHLRPIVIPINQRIIDIIRIWGNTPQSPQTYVFKILKPGLSPAQIHDRVHDFYSDINSVMKNIAAELEINNPVTTYVARHSYATVMKRKGAPLEFISESLGHSDIRTTESYLASFDLDTKRIWNSKLLEL